MPAKIPADKFVLKGSGVEVNYTIGPTPGAPTLVYRQGDFEKVFASSEIRSNDTDLGKFVSVRLISTVDTGGQRFGFFLPLIDVAHAQTVDFHTVGIYESFSGPLSIPYQPEAWRCIAMIGTAQVVAVPVWISAEEP